MPKHPANPRSSRTRGTASVTLGVVLVLLVLGWGLLAKQAHVVVGIEEETAAGVHVCNHIRRWYDASTNLQARASLEMELAGLVPGDSPYPYRLYLLEDPRPTIFAAPGGQIVVFTGWLAKQADAETMREGLAKEIAHVEARHGIQAILEAIGPLEYMVALRRGYFSSMEAIEALTDMEKVQTLFAYGPEMKAEAEDISKQLLVRMLGQDHRIAGSAG